SRFTPPRIVCPQPPVRQVCPANGADDSFRAQSSTPARLSRRLSSTILTAISTRYPQGVDVSEHERALTRRRLQNKFYACPRITRRCVRKGKPHESSRAPGAQCG